MERSKGTVYLAGKISGDEKYKVKFETAERALIAAGYHVCNPAMLPQTGFSWEQLMRMSGAMLDECETVCFLPDWIHSKGAILEMDRATKSGKKIVHFISVVNELENKK